MAARMSRGRGPKPGRMTGGAKGGKLAPKPPAKAGAMPFKPKAQPATGSPVGTNVPPPPLAPLAPMAGMALKPGGKASSANKMGGKRGRR